MTLTTGTLYLVGSSGAPTSSIQYELEGVYTGIGLLEAIAITGESWDSMRDFSGYNYNPCSDPLPVISSVSGVDAGFFATISWTTSSAGILSFWYQTAISPWTSWSGPYSVPATPLYKNVTLGNGSWKARVAGVTCAGTGSYTTSAAWTMS